MLVLDVAMLEHQEMVRGVGRRQMIKELSKSRESVRFAGIRKTVGQSLISAGEWIHIDAAEQKTDELAGEKISMSLSC